MRTFLVLTIAALLLRNPNIFPLNDIQSGVYTLLTIVGAGMAFIEDIGKMKD